MRRKQTRQAGAPKHPGSCRNDVNIFYKELYFYKEFSFYQRAAELYFYKELYK